MLSREIPAFDSRIRKIARTITHADLTAASNGLEQDILIGALPPGAVYLGRSFKITTYFTGGSASAVTMALGSGASPGTPNLLMTAANVFDTTTTAVWLKGTDGALVPMSPLPSTSIYAQFDADAGHTLLALTAGSVDVEVYYCVPDARV